MPTTDPRWPLEFQVDGAVTRLLVGLRDMDPRPDLEALARLVVEAWRVQPQMRWACLAVNPATAALLDPDWTGRRRGLLTGTAEGMGPWSALDGEWDEGPTADLLVWGTGDCLRDGCVATGLAVAASWVRLRIQAAGQTALVVSLGFTDDIACHPEWGQEVLRQGRILQLVCDLWTEMATLEADLGRARDEKTALSRLNRLQSRLVGMAAHEIKTPLTSISAYADALGGLITQDEGHACEFVGVIRNEAGRLLRMVNRILDFSRLDSGLRLLGGEATDLRDLLDETLVALRPIITAKRLRCHIESEDAVPRAVVDADLIRQVLVNLVGNAVKFTPEEGTITLTLAEAASGVEVRIADTGPGIPSRDIHRIFREFYRSRETATSQEGTGLGLTIVRHIINLHGGSVEARQRMGGGSVFTFKVPKEVHASGPLPAACTVKVDEAEARRLLGGILQLVAEMTEARGASLWLSEGREIAPVATLGWPEDAESRGPAAMAVPLRTADGQRGRLTVGRPLGRESFSEEDRGQLEVLARIAVTALEKLTRPGIETDEISGTALVQKTGEALRALLQIKRGGIPTAAAEALHMLGELARAVGMAPGEISDLQVSAALHDAGMARLEDEILLGRSELSFDERDEVDRHVEQGVDLMAPLMPNERCVRIIRQHHERIDGSGYPDGLRGEEIVPGARLLAVIDAWFSLTRGRPFRQGLSEAEALQEIKDNAGSQFDPEVVTAFEDLIKIRDGARASSSEPGSGRPVN